MIERFKSFTFKDTPTIDALTYQVTQQLAVISESAVLDTQVLIAHILGKNRTWVVSHPEFQLSAAQLHDLDSAVQELLRGQPLPYVIGEWEFYGLSFLISPYVLIPRPETELMVDHALAWCRRRSNIGADSLTIADIGTGTGCIAISLLSNLQSSEYNPRLAASDISMPALRIARANAERHQVTSYISFLQTNLLTGYQSTSLDLICANLPYIPSDVLTSLAVNSHEPRLALDGGPTGLTYIHQFLVQASFCLRPGGLLLAEIESSQGKSILKTAQAIFTNAHIELIQDYASHDRLLRIQELSAGKQRRLRPTT